MHHATSQPAEAGNDILSRRAALKRLAAATGAIAVSSLPDKWETPVIDVGTLPAHAQTSPISSPGPTATFTGINDCDAGGGSGSGSTLVVTSRYDTPGGNPLFEITVVLTGGSGGNITPPNPQVDGDQFSGIITFTSCIQFGTHTNLQVILTIYDDTIIVVNQEWNFSPPVGANTIPIAGGSESITFEHKPQ